MSANLNTIVTMISALSIADQRALNAVICANIRHANRVNAVQKSASFNVGDTIQFNAKTRGQIHLKVTGFSRDRTKLKGVQLNQGWKTSPGVNWTVAASVVQASTFVKA